MDTLVQIHSLLRWLVLLAGVVSLAVALAAWFGSTVSGQQTRQALLIYAVLLDVEVLLGIIIWIAEQRWAGGGRQFQFEHPLMMLVALAVAHVAAARARRVPAPRLAARMRALGSGLSLLLIVAGIPWNRGA
jgi:hypothetical protein